MGILQPMHILRRLHLPWLMGILRSLTGIRIRGSHIEERITGVSRSVPVGDALLTKAQRAPSIRKDKRRLRESCSQPPFVLDRRTTRRSSRGRGG